METTRSSADTKHKTIHIKRIFDLPLSTVWRAWTDRKLIKNGGGPKNYTCPMCKIDLRVGGEFFSSMKDKKTGQEMFSTGIYKEIVPNKKLVMTDNFADSEGNVIPPPSEMPGSEDWKGPLLVTVELSEKDGKTELSLTHEDMPLKMHEDCIAGWQECFDKLETNIK